MTAQEQFRHVRSKMVEKGVTNTAISKECGISMTYIHYILSGQRTGYRVRRTIAAMCQVPVEALFPDTPEEYRHAA